LSRSKTSLRNSAADGKPISPPPPYPAARHPKRSNKKPQDSPPRSDNGKRN
jgi:hypothetical protein